MRINVEQQRQKTAVISAETETREQIWEEPCIDRGFRISSAVPPTRTMFRPFATAKAIFAGLMVTLLQLGMAVLLLAPEGPANIVKGGYQTIVPPISYKMMEVSNTAFFPAYPGVVAALHYGLGLATENALLITAQAAAWGFWTYFFLFCNRWNLPPAWQLFGALGIASHPAAFFLVAAYSESLFLMALLGFLFWTGEETRQARVWAALHGMVMSATRIVGLPCAFVPFVRRVWELGWRGIVNVRDWFRNYGEALLASYHWFTPALENPTEASQMAMTIGALMLLALALLEFSGAFRRRLPASDRVAFYFAAAVLFFVSVAGVASVGMESMLRYEFCVHALIVLALLHYLHNVPLRSRLARASAVTAIALISGAGLSLESWYVWNFTRGNWVA